jgi:effector-binding domain-containing protein
VWAQGYTLDGDLYEEDLVNNTAAEDPRRYLLRLYVKIKQFKG